MVAWCVDEDRVEKVGSTLAAFREITHCYRRNPTPEWKYNLYTMVHAATEEDCRALVQRLSDAAGETDFSILFSRQELKKTSMKYFED